MADAPRDYSIWIPFLDYCIERAITAKFPIDSAGRWREAVRLTIEETFRNQLDICWCDEKGEEHFDRPSMLSPYYDAGEDALIDRYGGTRAYRVRVRERRATTAPVIASDAKPDEIVSGEDGGHDQRDEFANAVALAAVEASDSGRLDALVVNSVALAAVEASDSGRLDALVVDRWPWQKDPSLRRPEGCEPRRIQQECEQRLKPSIQHLSVRGICEALEKAGLSDTSDSSVRRAFGHK